MSRWIDARDRVPTSYDWGFVFVRHRAGGAQFVELAKFVPNRTVCWIEGDPGVVRSFRYWQPIDFPAAPLIF